MQHPPTPELEKAERLMAEGQYAAASQLLKTLLEVNERDWLVHALLGDCYRELGDVKLCEYHVGQTYALYEPEESLSGDPYCRALKAKADFNFHRAERECRIAIEEDPEHVAAWATLAEVLFLRHKWVESLKAANRVLALEPGNVEALRWRAEALRMLGREDAERSTVEAALSEPGDNATAHLMAGDSALLRGRHKQALRHYQRAWELDPDLEAAQIGVCESLRSRNPVYRLTLRASLLFARKRWAGVLVSLSILLAASFGAEFASGIVGAVSSIVYFGLVGGIIVFTVARANLQDFWLQFFRDGRRALPRRFRVAANVVTPLLLIGAMGIGGHFLIDGDIQLLSVLVGAWAVAAAMPVSVAVQYPEDFRWFGYGLAGLCWAAILVNIAYGFLGSSWNTFMILMYVYGGALALSMFLRVNATRLRMRR